RPRCAVFLAVLVALALAPAASASRNAGIAALQVALHARGLYLGTIDGQNGPATTVAIKQFQLRAGLRPDGVPGAATRRALGRYGKHMLGSRPLTRGATGWDVAALQFLLAWHGFPSSTIDGGLGDHTERALVRFQRWARLTPDGVAGATTYAALRKAPSSCPGALAWPVDGPARRCAPVAGSASWARPATRRGRTSISRSGCAAPRSIPSQRCRSAASGGTLGAWRRSAT